MSPRPDGSGRGMSFCSHCPQSRGRQEERPLGTSVWWLILANLSNIQVLIENENGIEELILDRKEQRISLEYQKETNN